jgi:iron complex outermembrane receptor protein
MFNRALSDHWAARLTGYQTHDDGWIKNLYNAKDSGEINRMGVRVQTLYKPSDDFDLRLIQYDHNDENSSTGTLVPYTFARLSQYGAKANLTYPEWVTKNGGLITTNANNNQVDFNSLQSMKVQQNGASAKQIGTLGEGIN